MNLLLGIEKAAGPEMQLSSWLMLLFGVVVLIGGLLLCIRVAIRADRRRKESPPTGDD